MVSYCFILLIRCLMYPNFEFPRPGGGPFIGMQVLKKCIASKGLKMNPGYKRFATSDRANLERDRTKLIPHAVLPRFLAQHVCHGPGLGFFQCIPVHPRPGFNAWKIRRGLFLIQKMERSKVCPCFFQIEALMLGIVLGTVGRPSRNQWCSGREDEKKWQMQPQNDETCFKLLVPACNWSIDCSWFSLLSGFCQADLTCATCAFDCRSPSPCWASLSPPGCSPELGAIFRLRMRKIRAEWSYWCPEKKSTAWPLGLYVSLIFFILLFLLFFDVFICKCSMV